MVPDERLQIALAFAARGARVYVVQRDSNKPVKKGWRETATVDATQIRGWWSEYGGCNYGMITDDKIVCLDIDRKNGKDGFTALAALEAEIGPFPPTHTDATPNNGEHRFFEMRDGLQVGKADLAEGLEFLGVGGSVALPATFFPNGQSYRTTANSMQFATCPDAAVALVVKRKGNGEPKTEVNSAAAEEVSGIWRAWINKSFEGATWRGDEVDVRCAFHDDQHASCSVNIKKLTFYCHTTGCHAKGKLPSLAMRMALTQGKPAPMEVMPRKGVGGAMPKETSSEALVRIAEEFELFSDGNGNTYATMEVDEHLETWGLKTQTFADILSHRYYLEEGKVPGGEALRAASGTLRGRALFEGEKIPVHVRLAGTDERIYLDLGDPEWRCVEITAQGWSVVDAPEDLRFRRPPGMQELQEPTKGGKLSELIDFINCASGEDILLVLTWLVAACRPGANYPVLSLNGEQGSGKSTVARRLRELIDPNQAILRTTPREEDDLLIAATNGWMISFDNISSLPYWLSDGLCRLATGAGFSKRTLYTDGEETIFSAARPIVINGIPDLTSRGDLLDRSILVTLPILSEEARKTERALEEAFNEAKPRILGGLLDVVVAAMCRLPETHLTRPPRMADFATWSCSAAEALGTTQEEFLRIYRENRTMGDQLVIEGSIVAAALLEWMGAHESGSWRGSSKDLLVILQELQAGADAKDFPKTAERITRELKRIAPALRKRGVDVRFEKRERNMRPIRIDRRADPSAPAPAAVPGSPA